MLCALTLLALAAVADASPQAPADESPYALEALAGGFNRSLEPDMGTMLPARDRAVEIRWMAREAPGLSGYRLTVEIQGSVLSGTVASWTIDSGTGRPLGTEGRRAYRIGLPLRAEPGLAIRALLEGVRADGRLALLARLDDRPWERRGAACAAAPPGPRLASEAADETPGLLPAAACIAESALGGLLPPSSNPDPEGLAPASHRACRDVRERGPPLRADL